MAARIPPEFLDHLLSRIDLVELIDSRMPLRRAGREYSACCPFHTEKTPSFTVSPSKQFYHCFGCGAHGTAIGFLMEYERLEFLDAIEELARLAGLEVPRGLTGESNKPEGLLTLLVKAERFFQQQLSEHPTRHKAVAYLHNRGVDDATIRAFNIGYAPPGWDNLLKAMTARGVASQDLVMAGLVLKQDDGLCRDRFRDRIMFPIHDRRGRTVAFGGRALGEVQPKYLNSPETPVFHKGSELYGLYEARTKVRQVQRLLVVEGYMDVVALSQHGVPYAVATLGTATTLAHLERLFRTTYDITFCFDGDVAGRNAAWRALETTLPLLREGRRVHFLFLPEGEDPDSLVRKEGRQAFELRLEQALSLSDYVFERLSANVDTRTLDERARMAEQACALFDKMPDSVYRDMIMQRLAEMAGLGKVDIENRLTASVPAVVPLTRPTNPTRTPVRLAIAHLLNDIHLARLAGNPERFQAIDLPGLLLLRELIELLQSHPHIEHAGQVLARYEGTEEGRVLKRLAEWQPPYPSEFCEKEFLDTLVQLENSLQKNLLDKFVQGKLNPEEKERLRDLSQTSSKPLIKE